MRLKFTKMHGLGNDFVVLDAMTQLLSLTPRQLRFIADRHFGIGCDQVLVVEPPGNPDVDFRYRIFNADGKEVEQCGNGARCFARFVRERKLTAKRVIRVETAGGILELRVRDNHQVEVNMGVPSLEPADIPLIAPARALDYAIDVQGQTLRVGAVSMGNPHAILQVDDVDTAQVAAIGPVIESHPAFPKRVNAGFMQCLSDSEIRLRVYERGVGETLACGSGACAAVVSGILRGQLKQTVTVHLPGGKLSVAWQGEGQPVMLTGPTAVVFEGTIKI